MVVPRPCGASCDAAGNSAGKPADCGTERPQGRADPCPQTCSGDGARPGQRTATRAPAARRTSLTCVTLGIAGFFCF